MTNTHTTAHIPDQAVQAAEAQFTEYFLMNYPKDCIIYNPAWHAPKIFRAAKAAITENLPHLSAPCSVEAKKLTWHNVDAVCAWCYADTEFGQYRVTWSFNETGQKLHFPDGTTKQFNEKGYGDREAAKAAAQADFERRILSNVVTKPVDVAAVRKEVFEEAACRLDAEAEEAIIRSEKCSDDMYDEFYNDGQHFKQSAAIVRALSAEPAQSDQWKPVETAPKDGSEFLARCNTDKPSFSCFWDGHAFAHYSHGEGLIFYSPIEWMPLPAATTSEAGK